MADPEPPQPMPFPIRIVSDNDRSESESTNAVDSTTGKSDYFYQAWDKFLAREPKRAKRTSRSAKKVEDEKIRVAEGHSTGLKVEENAAKSWEQAAAECRAKVAAIVEECVRLNQKYRDAIFDLEASPYCLQGLNGRFPKAVKEIGAPPWIKRVEDIFSEPQFFIDGATATDVHQGSGGDCWFLASLMAVSAKHELIDNLCVARDERVGVYGFVFYRDGEWIYEVIDDKLFLRVGDDDYIEMVRDWDKDKKEGMSLKHDHEKLKETLQRGGEALYFSHCKSNETWLPLIEKAYAKAHGDYSAIEGGFVSEGIEDLTGGVAVVINPEDIMDKQRFWRDQLSQVNIKYLFGGGTKASGSMGFVGGHAYTVLEAWEEGDLKLLKLRNPWGEVEWEGDWSDGNKLWTPDMMKKLNHQFGDDGVFWISYKDFLKHFPNINRVRLFDKDWQVAQQWTCVDVPWTVDYLDTKFEITVTTQSPLVIVLAQPDDRYFYGLRGRHLFSMHFRVYKEGELGKRYLVRSMHNSGNETVFTRSVSAELEDLAPGRYFVIFKITAVRTQQSTAEQAIFECAGARKEKLLQVGRRFDYAQTKGNLRESEKQDRKLKGELASEDRKKRWKRERKLNKKLREKMKLRKKRISDVVKEKERELRKHEKDRQKKRRERKRERRRSKSMCCGKEVQANAGTEDTHVKKKKDAEVTPPSEEEEVQHDENIQQGSSTHSAQPAAAVTGNAATATPSSSDNGERLAKQMEADSTEHSLAATEVEDKRNEFGGSKDLSDSLAKLEIKSGEGPKSTESNAVSPLVDDQAAGMDENNDDYESDDSPPSPFEPPEDDDFDWDSEIDGPVSDSTASQGSENSDLDIFNQDPWNAMCVIGLRVYSKGDVKVRVIQEDDDNDDERQSEP